MNTHKIELKNLPSSCMYASKFSELTSLYFLLRKDAMVITATRKNGEERLQATMSAKRLQPELKFPGGLIGAGRQAACRTHDGARRAFLKFCFKSVDFLFLKLSVSNLKKQPVWYESWKHTDDLVLR